jgi:hypothetical protein
VDVIEEEADAHHCDADSSWGEAEEPDVDCFSQGASDEEVDVFPVGVEVEDLGKRKGTNAARDEIVKKLRETPPNANTNQGGFR